MSAMPPPSSPPAIAWSRNAQLAAAFLCGIVLTLLAQRVVRSVPRPTQMLPVVPASPLPDGRPSPMSASASPLGITSVAGPADGFAPVKKITPGDARLDLNEATADMLRLLPGIGPKLSEAIVESRTTRGPFHSVEDLRRVRGIGPKTIERLRPLVIVGPAASPLNGSSPTSAAMGKGELP